MKEMHVPMLKNKTLLHYEGSFLYYELPNGIDIYK